MRDEANLLRDLWRVASRHDDLQDVAQAFFERFRTEAPARWMRLLRFDDRRGRLTNAASAGEAPTVPLRVDLPTPRSADLAAWARGDGLGFWSWREQDAVSRVLGPDGVAGPFAAVALRIDTEIRGIAVFGGELARFAVALRLAAEPLTAMLDTDARLHELARLREAAEADRNALLERLDQGSVTTQLVGAESGLSLVMRRIAQVARTDAPVVLFGETGSGKEVISRAIHDRSPRHDAPFLKVNCGAIPPELVDSELFGHEKGAFTGAHATRKGWFERADGGTLFLDEIGELPPPAQVRLLRVLQDGSFQRVGGERTLQADVRVIAATHRDLAAMARRGEFRWDLWYRLSVFPITIPPLRARRQDIPDLARHFASRAGRKIHGRELTPTQADIAMLVERDWPGNVRELGAVIERAVILGDGNRLEVRQALGPERGPPPADDRAAIEEVVARCLGRIEGPFGAAAALGVNAATLRSRMRRLGIDWERYRLRSSDGG